MNINEIAKSITREEFEKCLVLNYRGDLFFEYEDFRQGCPHNLGLQTFIGNECTISEDNCRKCWMKSVECIKFKNDKGLENIKKYSVDLKDKIIFRQERKIALLESEIIKKELEIKRLQQEKMNLERLSVMKCLEISRMKKNLRDKEIQIKAQEYLMDKVDFIARRYEAGEDLKALIKEVIKESK